MRSCFRKEKKKERKGKERKERKEGKKRKKRKEGNVYGSLIFVSQNTATKHMSFNK